MENPATLVFNITELRELIINELARELDKRTLAVLARVNTLLHDSSIRRLWNGEIVRGSYVPGKHDPSIFPHLLGLLPEDLIIWSQDQWSLIRPPIESDWGRFQHYSTHVTRLTLRGPNCSDTVWDAFSSRCLDLLPSVKDLELHSLSAKDISGMPWLSFITPSVRYLCISTTNVSHLSNPICDNAPDTLSILCQHLVDHAPNLAELVVDDFRGVFPLEQTSSSLSRVIPLLCDLRVFEWYTVVPFPFDVMERLANHPFLTDLYIGSSCRQESLVPSNSPQWFPSLRRLHLLANSPFITSLANNLSNPELLDDISFEFEDGLSSLSMFVPLFWASRTNLKAVVLDLGSVVTSWSEFQPILACEGMIRFRVECGSLIQGFNDDALHELASAWRNLEELEITPWLLSSNVEHQLTWLSLVSLAQLCTHLRDIRLNFSTRTRFREHYLDAGSPQTSSSTQLSPTQLRNDPTPYYRILRQQFPSSNLYLFDACFSEINSGDHSEREDFLGPAEMSRVIQTLWPSFDLTRLTCCWDCSDGERGDLMRERWMRVQHYSLLARNGEPSQNQ